MQPNIAHDAADLDYCEYVAAVDWKATVPRAEAKWLPRSRLFATQLGWASLDAQPATIAFVEESFGVNLGDLADEEL